MVCPLDMKDTIGSKHISYYNVFNLVECLDMMSSENVVTANKMPEHYVYWKCGDC